MRVLLEFSRGGLEEHGRAIEHVREAILEEGHVLTNDLLASTSSESKEAPLPEDVYGRMQRAIANAQCVVIEGTVVSISLGYVLTEAINLGKPVLFLVRGKFNKRNRFVTSFKSKLLTHQNYETTDELPQIISDFFKHHNDIRTRFNLVLSNYLNSYITVESRKKGISKTEYIIELIEDDELRKYGKDGPL